MLKCHDFITTSSSELCLRLLVWLSPPGGAQLHTEGRAQHVHRKVRVVSSDYTPPCQQRTAHFTAWLFKVFPQFAFFFPNDPNGKHFICFFSCEKIFQIRENKLRLKINLSYKKKIFYIFTNYKNWDRQLKGLQGSNLEVIKCVLFF